MKEDTDIEELKRAFIAQLPDDIHAEEIFEECADSFYDEELAEICEETAQTINAECTRDDFHNWNYDHLEFIIGLSNRYGFHIPRNLLNGLPEQLILLVDSDKVRRPDCED